MATNKGWSSARLGIIVVALVFAVTLSAFASTVNGLAVKKSDDKVEIHVGTSGVVNYKVLSSSKPKQALILEMPGVQVQKQAEKIVNIDRGIVSRARLVQYTPGTARLVVEVLYPVEYSIQRAPEGYGLLLVMKTQPIKGKAKVSKAVSRIETVEEPVITPDIKTPKTEKTTVEKSKPAVPPVKMATAKPAKTAYQHKQVKAVPKKKKVTKKKPVKLVSFDFVNADLVYVMKLLAQELKINLVMDDTVSGSVTMDVKDITPQTAVNIILTLNGFKQKKLGNILFVGSEDTINAITPDIIDWVPSGDAKLQVFQLENIPATDAVSAIKAQYPMIQAKEGTGANVVVQADQKTLNNIRTLIAGIDVPAPEEPPAPAEKMELVRLNYAKADEIKSTLEKVLGDNKPGTFEVEKRLNGFVVRGRDEQIKAVKDYLTDLDLPLDQVMLSVKVIEVSESGAKNLGISWQVGSEDGTQIKFYEIPAGYNTSGNAYDPYQDNQPASAAPMPIGFFVRDPFVMRASLSMQIDQGEAKVLASPRVVTMDSEKAEIHVGEQYPIVYFDPRAGQYQMQPVEIGIKLTVTPTISPDGYITADIEPNVSNLLDLINNQYPRTAERKAKVKVRVKDGDTIVIGGMVDESLRKSVTKMPLLGDIPILGNLFKATNTNRSKTEVVIMITPKIIKN